MKKDDTEAVDFITEASGDQAFGKTSRAAFTPAIRENMAMLYRDKLGLFVHWGPYAQLAGLWKGREVDAEWIMHNAPISVRDYEEHAARPFQPNMFDARAWVDIAEQAGMSFIVVTAKHHDGFAMYRSKHPYNLVDFAGYGRDIFKELADECSRRGMKLGFYYSQSQDWHEEGAVGNTWDFQENAPEKGFDTYFEEKVVPQIEELTTQYGDIFMVWFDTPVYMADSHCEKLMRIIKKNQPGALVNSRLGNGYGHFDVSIDGGKSPSVCTSDWLPDLKVPWQTHATVTAGGWGYTRHRGEKDRSHVWGDDIYNVSNVVGSGGVFLLNVGPRPDGVIPPSQVDSLRAVGTWLAQNGEAIYGADPSPLKFPPFAMTSKPGRLYLHLRPTEGHHVCLQGVLSRVTRAYCLADPSKTPLEFSQDAESIQVSLPIGLGQQYVTVVVLELVDSEARVVDEALQQGIDGSISLPVEKCEFTVRRISYDYARKVTVRWGESPQQGLVWTVNVKTPGEFRAISEDTGDEQFEYQLTTNSDSLILKAEGEPDTMTKREQAGTILIEKPGQQKISVHPQVMAKSSRRYKFKGLELIPLKATR